MKLWVYGTLKQGFRLNGWMEDQKFLGKVKTQPGYILLDLGWFPGLVEGNTEIEGEVWEVDVDYLLTLDDVESGAFCRRQIQLQSPFDKDYVEAYHYIGNREGCLQYQGNNWQKC